MRSICLIGSLVLSTLALTAHADTITITETLTGNAFSSNPSSQPMTITGIGDTSNVVYSSANGYTLLLNSVTVQEGSDPLVSFTGSLEAFVTDGGFMAGIAELSPRNSTVLAVTGQFVFNDGSISVTDPFAGYALDSDITETGTTQVPYGVNLNTSGSSFNLENYSDTATFSSTVTPSPTPEPSSLALLATGLLGLGETLRRKYRASQSS